MLIFTPYVVLTINPKRNKKNEENIMPKDSNKYKSAETITAM